MVARESNTPGHGPSPERRRTRVLRAFQQNRVHGPLKESSWADLLVAQHPRQQTDDGIHHHRRRNGTIRQDEIPD